MQKGLGRGLSALIGENFFESRADGLPNKAVILVKIKDIEANPNQPRTIFDTASLEELSNSILQNGVLQPILLKAISDSKYQIIAGERRWRAVKNLGIEEIPAIIKDIAESEILELALIENIQRENLTPLEEAECYQRLIEECNYTQEKMAQIVSKSRSHIANLLRLISLPAKVKEYFNKGLISLGHAKLLAGQDKAEVLADIIVKENLNVREAENLIRKNRDYNLAKVKESNSDNATKEEDLKALESYLTNVLKMLVKIEGYAEGTSKISIHCRSLSDLDQIVQKLSGSID